MTDPNKKRPILTGLGVSNYLTLLTQWSNHYVNDGYASFVRRFRFARFGVILSIVRTDWQRQFFIFGTRFALKVYGIHGHFDNCAGFNQPIRLWIAKHINFSIIKPIRITSHRVGIARRLWKPSSSSASDVAT